MHAEDMAEEFPVITVDTNALDAARMLAEHRLPGILVTDTSGKPYAVLPASQVVRFIVPTYVQDDPSLAGVINESWADKAAEKLGDKKVHDVLPEHLTDVPAANADDTIIEVAALMARFRSPLDRRHEGPQVARCHHCVAVAGRRAEALVPMAAIAITVFVIAYILIASDRINKTLVALCGAAVDSAPSPIVGADDAFFSHETGIDWNVIFLLFGMMIIVGVLRQTGVFEYMAIWAAKRANGSPLRIMILLVLVTAFASALLDNVTTVLLIAPVTLLVCERLEINPVPFLIAEVLASNIGGASTLVGDPPNIIIASRAGLDVQRLSHPHGADRGDRPGRLHRLASVHLPRILRCRSRTGGGRDDAERARSHSRSRDCSSSAEPYSSPCSPRSSGTRWCTSNRPWSHCSAPAS